LYDEEDAIAVHYKYENNVFFTHMWGPHLHTQKHAKCKTCTEGPLDIRATGIGTTTPKKPSRGHPHYHAGMQSVRGSSIATDNAVVKIQVLVNRLAARSS